VQQQQPSTVQCFIVQQLRHTAAATFCFPTLRFLLIASDQGKLLVQRFDFLLVTRNQIKLHLPLLFFTVKFLFLRFRTCNSSKLLLSNTSSTNLLWKVVPEGLEGLLEGKDHDGKAVVEDKITWGVKFLVGYGNRKPGWRKCKPGWRKQEPGWRNGKPG